MPGVPATEKTLCSPSLAGRLRPAGREGLWCGGVKRVLSVLALGLAGSGAVAADSPGSYDRLWGRSEFYRADGDALVQSVRLRGRLQLDLARVDSGDDDHGELNVRRFRLGFETAFRGGWTLHLEGDFDPQGADPFYRRLTDAYLEWQRDGRFELTVGKHSAGFTLDGMTSSKRLLTIDRSNLANNLWFPEEYIPGASVAGETSGLIYRVGVFSSGSRSTGFGDFEGGEFYLVTLGHDFADRLGAEEALLRLNLVDNEPRPADGFTRPLERVGSLNFSYRTRRWGLGADLAAASGAFEQSDLQGLLLLGFLRSEESFEVVGRYTLVESDGANGVRFARYERSLAAGRGDRYDEVYLGFNYYVYGHELKLQSGVQYVEMRDQAGDGGAYAGWGGTVAARLSW